MLSIFYYVGAALFGCFACFPIIHLVIGLMMALDPGSMNGGSGGGSPPPPALGWIMAAFAGAFILIGWASAISLFFTARFITRRKHHLFCLVISGIACLNIPLGTILGVFSFIILLRPTVKELFGVAPTPGPGSGV